LGGNHHNTGCIVYLIRLSAASIPFGPTPAGDLSIFGRRALHRLRRQGATLQHPDWAGNYIAFELSRSSPGARERFTAHIVPMRSEIGFHPLQSVQSRQAHRSRQFGNERRVPNFVRWRGQGRIGGMPRADAQRGYSSRLREIVFRAARSGIGQELKAYYEPSQDLPRNMFVLLMQTKDQSSKQGMSNRQKQTGKSESSGFNDGPTRSGTP
jgi:hypothetical protein